MRVVHIPIDSRPCNLRFPAQIAEMAGGTLILPDEMDNFTEPASFEKLRAFLEREAPQADHLVISVDHWCYGSLLASRNDDLAIETAFERLRVLSEIMKAHPRMRVWAYSVIMRSSISALNTDDLPYYNLMTEFSQQWYRSRGNAEEKKKLDALEARIPKRILDRYFYVRKRNHAINVACAEMAMSGQFKKLQLLMEDSQEFGFHTVEQQEIKALIGDAPNIYIHNGTDEGGMMLVAAAFTENLPPLKMRAVYLGGDKERFWAMLEDRPFCKNVDSQCKSIGIEQVEEGEDCVLLIVLPSDNEQKDISCSAPLPENCAEEIIRVIDAGKPAVLLDVQAMNCGDMRLLKALGKENLFRLSGYAAWNTASNALGTALAQLRAQKDPFGAPSRAFLIERLLDDGLYQGDVRQRVNPLLVSRGEDVYHLKDKAAADALLSQVFLSAMREDPALGFDALPVEISLPWARTFEADVRLKKEEA